MLQEAWTSWAHFPQFAKDILSELQKDKRLSLEGAYRRIVVPKIKELERKAMADELRRNVNAGSRNPASSSPMTHEEESKLPMSELLRREFARVKAR